jgi:hypothetical protein
MSLLDQSFSNYSINNNEISLEENDAASLFNEQEHQQCQIPQDQDFFFPQLSSQYHEFIIHEEEEESRHPSLENLTQSILDYQNLINDEKPLSQTIQPVLEQNNEPKNKQDFSQLNIIQKETTNTSLTKVTPDSTNGNGNKLLGRKRREDKGKGVHSKYKPDNQMRKIKSYYIKYITENVNASLSPEHKKFLKITPDVNEDLNTNYNLDLMKKLIKEIYVENPINKRYSKEEIELDYNKDLIEEIYRKNEETKAIRILNMTYIEYLDFMRKNDIDKFKHDLIKKEIKNGETEKEAIKYVDDLVDLLMDYEGWFERKTPRTPRKEKDS